MEIDGNMIAAIGTTLMTAGASAFGAVKWVCARVDKQFAEVEAKSAKEREKFEAELKKCDDKHEKCEADRLKFLEEVLSLRHEVKAIAKIQADGSR